MPKSPWPCSSGASGSEDSTQIKSVVSYVAVLSGCSAAFWNDESAPLALSSPALFVLTSSLA